jgi:hypothetical protein
MVSSTVLVFTELAVGRTQTLFWVFRLGLVATGCSSVGFGHAFGQALGAALGKVLTTSRVRCHLVCDEIFCWFLYRACSTRRVILLPVHKGCSLCLR